MCDSLTDDSSSPRELRWIILKIKLVLVILVPDCFWVVNNRCFNQLKDEITVMDEVVETRRHNEDTKLIIRKDYKIQGGCDILYQNIRHAIRDMFLCNLLF